MVIIMGEYEVVKIILPPSSMLETEELEGSRGK